MTYPAAPTKAFDAKSLRLTALSLALAAIVGSPIVWPQAETAAPEIGTQLRTLLPNADPLLLDRTASSWGYTAVDAAEKHGEAGLFVLEMFGDESAYCLKHQPKAFEALTDLWKLDPVRFRLTTKSYNRAVLDWAQNGMLEGFLRRLSRIPHSSLSTADDVPGALRLLLDDHCPKSQAILDKHGNRAWRLLLAINFIDSPPSAERVATAIERYGDLILDLNDEFGLPSALMLIEPATENESRYIPKVVKHACEQLDRSLAVTLLLMNYDDVSQMLDAGSSVQGLCEAIDHLAAQPEFVQMLAAECPTILRLLSEKWGQQMVGIEAFRRCGPAASIAYNYYASDARMSRAAVVAMGRAGWPAFVVFDKFRDYGPFFDLLRRSELLQPGESDPLVIDIVWNIARLGQEKIDIYRTVENLRTEVMVDRKPPPDSEMYLEWIPLYMAYRVGEKYFDGRHISNGELLFATVDVALTLTPMKGVGKAANGAKGLAGSIEHGATTIAAMNGLSQAERSAATAALKRAEAALLSQAEKGSLEILKREGVELAHFGLEAGKIAMNRLEARGDGIALGLADRSAEYSVARQAGDLGKKSLIAEEIGMAGMERYARETGRKPLYVGKPRQGAGFDGVFEDGRRILVIEAKGGGSQVKHFHGYWQGTPEYTREVAKSVLARSSATAEEKSAADKVLKAFDEGRLDIEVLRTEHVQGKPLPTRIESGVSTGDAVPQLAPNEIKSILLRTPGAAAAIVRDSGLVSSRLTMDEFVSRSQAMAKRTGVELWTPGAGPLMPRTVRRKGKEVIIRSFELPSVHDAGGVGEFGIAVMERILP